MTMEHSLKILLADNKEIIHQTIADYLQNSGHKVDRVHDRFAALKAVEEREYHLALVDMIVLDIDEINFLVKVQEVRPEMPVIIIIGCREMGTAIQAMRNGAVDFLTSPIKLLELDAALEKAVRYRSLIVQHIQAEEALRESERRYNSLAENVTDTVWITYMDPLSSDVPSAVTRMLGYDIGEAMTLTWADVLTSASFEIVRNIFTCGTNEKATEQSNLTILSSVDMEMLCKDGSTLWVEAQYAFLHNSDRQLVGIFGIMCNTNRHEKSRSS